MVEWPTHHSHRLSRMGGIGAVFLISQVLKVVTCKQMIRFKQSNISAHWHMNKTEYIQCIVTNIPLWGKHWIPRR